MARLERRRRSRRRGAPRAVPGRPRRQTRQRPSGAWWCRHGPMVMGVCRHVLHQDQDAEDAFQATFLTLARKAGTIRDRRILAGWLYEVAYRIAIRARASAVATPRAGKEGASMSPVSTAAEHENQAAWTELRPVLHDEVNRLPEKYRLPVILSYLEGEVQRGSRRRPGLAGRHRQGPALAGSRAASLAAESAGDWPSRRPSSAWRSPRTACWPRPSPPR